MIEIKIIGTGISGLLAAYNLEKLLNDHQNVKIVIYDSNKDEFVDNTTTHSLAWLNAIYPSKDNHFGFDMYRLRSLQAWKTLIKDLSKDGIAGISAEKQQQITIDGQPISSVYVFNNAEQQANFNMMSKRLQSESHQYLPTSISGSKLSLHFPFLSALNKNENIKICNVANEQIINPKALRTGLIHYLNSKGIQFHWNTVVTTEMMQSESNTYWVVAAGIGSDSLVKGTALENLQFSDSGLADVIYCTLEQPLHLNSVVFHFAASDLIPGFRVRNDETDPYKLKILVEFPPGKPGNLDNAAKDILKILGVTVKQMRCDNTIGRPQTKDGRPVIEIGKISTIYGHGLFSSAVLFYDFAKNLADRINQEQKKGVFMSGGYHDLSAFSSAGRFQTQSSQTYNSAVILKSKL